MSATMTVIDEIERSLRWALRFVPDELALGTAPYWTIKEHKQKLHDAREALAHVATLRSQVDRMRDALEF